MGIASRSLRHHCAGHSPRRRLRLAAPLDPPHGPRPTGGHVAGPQSPSLEGRRSEGLTDRPPADDVGRRICFSSADHGHRLLRQIRPRNVNDW